MQKAALRNLVRSSTRTVRRTGIRAVSVTVTACWPPTDPTHRCTRDSVAEAIYAAAAPGRRRLARPRSATRGDSQLGEQEDHHQRRRAPGPRGRSTRSGSAGGVLCPSSEFATASSPCRSRRTALGPVEVLVHLPQRVARPQPAYREPLVGHLVGRHRRRLVAQGQRQLGDELVHLGRRRTPPCPSRSREVGLGQAAGSASSLTRRFCCTASANGSAGAAAGSRRSPPATPCRSSAAGRR